MRKPHSTRLLPRASWLLLFAGALSLAECRDPTQITLEISTDAKCEDVRGTTIGVGRITELEEKSPVAQTEACSAASGRIGSLVVVPSGDKDGEVSIRVVTGVGKSPEACVNDGYKGGCIVARRTIRYLPHTPLEMPIELGVDCLDIPCGATQTCYKGQCVSPTIDPEKCEQGDCRPEGGDGGLPDAGPDAEPDAAPDAPPDVSVDAADGGSDAADADVTVSCTGPMAECDGDLSETCETNTSSDGQHCGACGHDCLGGACTAGKCGTVTVWSLTGERPTRLAIDATHIYFVDYSAGNVRRVSKDGKTVELLATGQTAIRVAVDDSFAYWTDNTGKRLMKVAKTGGTPIIVASDVNAAQAVKPTADRVYVSDYTSAGRIGWVPKAGGTTTWIATGVPWPSDIALTPAHAYFTSVANNGVVRRVPLDGGTVNDVLALDNSVAIEANADSVFVTSIGTGKGKGVIVRVPLAGGAGVTVASALQEPAGVTVDQTHLYYTDVGANTVNRIALQGSGNLPELLDANNSSPRGIVNDAVAIYWADELNGAIKKRAK